ncbi:MAG: microviridin/marinostatin family tricyclic proteinase inhibitor [Bacteroidales bacterium]
MKKPFFARFLENQLSNEDEQNIKGSAKIVAVTMKAPSDDDENVTMKYPSDGDENVTLKYPSDSDEAVEI